MGKLLSLHGRRSLCVDLQLLLSKNNLELENSIFENRRIVNSKLRRKKTDEDEKPSFMFDN